MESSDLLSRAAASARPDHAAAREQRHLDARLDVPQLPALIVALQKVANRVFSGLVLAGLLVASAMLLPYWRTLGTTGFVIAAILGVYMVLTILLSDRRGDRG